jgi:hypothetical protein
MFVLGAGGPTHEAALMPYVSAAFRRASRASQPPAERTASRASSGARGAAAHARDLPGGARLLDVLRAAPQPRAGDARLMHATSDLL